jgi:hypothetical protein
LRRIEGSIESARMHHTLGRILVVFGFLLILAGVGSVLLDGIPFLGKQPGDIHIQKKNLEFRFPIVACMVASIVLSFLLPVFFLWFKK